MSAVEDVATAIAATVRERQWLSYADRSNVSLWAGNVPVATLHCKDASQAERLAEMMRDKA